MEDKNQNPYLTVQEAGIHLRLKKRALDNMRWTGTGPLFRKHGGGVYCHIDKLIAWSIENRTKSTSQY